MMGNTAKGHVLHSRQSVAIGRDSLWGLTSHNVAPPTLTLVHMVPSVFLAAAEASAAGGAAALLWVANHLPPDM